MIVIRALPSVLSVAGPGLRLARAANPRRQDQSRRDTGAAPGDRSSAL